MTKGMLMRLNAIKTRSFLFALPIFLSACGTDFSSPEYDKVILTVSSNDTEHFFDSKETLFSRKSGNSRILNQLEKTHSFEKRSEITGFNINDQIRKVQYLDLSPLKKRLSQLGVDLTEVKGDELMAGEVFETQIKLSLQEKVGTDSDGDSIFKEKELLIGTTNLKLLSFSRAIPCHDLSEENKQAFMVLEFESDLKDSIGNIYPIRGSLEAYVVLDTY